MKKIIFVAVIAVLCGVVAQTSHAATTNIVRLSSKPSFAVNLKEVNRIAFTNKAKFQFETTDITNASQIDHWKMRVKCDGNIQIALNQATTNLCGKVTTLTTAQVNSFALYMTRGVNEKSVGYSFKLKGYDKSGKWLHSEQENFRW